MIEARGLVKTYDGNAVLSRLDLTIRTGEIYALLGRNGAGKSTLLKCLVGLLSPTEGSITIDGLDRRRDHLSIRRFTAWVADQPFLYTHMTGRTWLEMVADIYAVPGAVRDRRIDELLEAFDLGALGKTRVLYYSNGQHKKLALAAAFVTGARLFLMDEPFTGEVDPPGVAVLKEILLEQARRRGVTILFSTQMVDQAAQIADRVGLLAGGRIELEGSPAELVGALGARSLEDAVAGPSALSASDRIARLRSTFED